MTSIPCVTRSLDPSESAWPVICLHDGPARHGRSTVLRVAWLSHLANMHHHITEPRTGTAQRPFFSSSLLLTFSVSPSGRVLPPRLESSFASETLAGTTCCVSHVRQWDRRALVGVQRATLREYIRRGGGERRIHQPACDIGDARKSFAVST